MHLSIPVAVRLTSENSWQQLDDRQTVFGITRFHFYLEDVARDGKIVFGDAFGIYTKPKGVKIKRTDSETTTLERVVSHKSIENYLAQREELRELAAEVLTKSSILDVFKFSGSVRDRVSRKLAESFSLGQEIGDSLKSATTETVTIENELPPEFEGTVVSVPAYRRREVHLHLTHIDYLKVHYQRTTFGLRKKARSEPPVVDCKRHPNRIAIGTHFGTAFYWELLPRSCCFVMQEQHNPGVPSPTEVVIGPPQDRKARHIEFPKVPTLYQIARAAFPRKWIWRKSEKREWTEEQLMEIELDEVRGKPGWWERYGR